MVKQNRHGLGYLDVTKGNIFPPFPTSINSRDWTTRRGLVGA